MRISYTRVLLWVLFAFILVKVMFLTSIDASWGPSPTPMTQYALTFDRGTKKLRVIRQSGAVVFDSVIRQYSMHEEEGIMRILTTGGDTLELNSGYIWVPGRHSTNASCSSDALDCLKRDGTQFKITVESSARCIADIRTNVAHGYISSGLSGTSLTLSLGGDDASFNTITCYGLNGGAIVHLGSRNGQKSIHVYSRGYVFAVVMSGHALKQCSTATSVGSPCRLISNNLGPVDVYTSTVTPSITDSPSLTKVPPQTCICHVFRPTSSGDAMGLFVTSSGVSMGRMTKSRQTSNQMALTFVHVVNNKMIQLSVSATDTAEQQYLPGTTPPQPGSQVYQSDISDNPKYQYRLTQRFDPISSKVSRFGLSLSAGAKGVIASESRQVITQLTPPGTERFGCHVRAPDGCLAAAGTTTPAIDRDLRLKLWTQPDANSEDECKKQATSLAETCKADVQYVYNDANDSQKQSVTTVTPPAPAPTEA